MAAPTKDYKSYLTDLENVCEEYLVKKAPAIPDNVREAIVKFGPWISLILLIMSAPVILGLLGLGALLTPFSYLGGMGAGFSYTASIIFTIVVMVMQIIALPGLFKRKMSSWRMMFYAALVETVHNVIIFNLGGLIIGTLLSLYVLFQVRKLYS